MQSSGSLLKQLSVKEAWKSTSNRWSGKDKYNSGGGVTVDGCEASLNQMEGFAMQGNEDNGMVVRKRVMVVVDHTSHSKHAMMWALTHVANKGDLLTLLHVVPQHRGSESSCSTYLVNYLGSLCKDCKPEPCGSNISSNTEEFAEQCINKAECLAIGVRKRSQGNNGYLISTRWQKNFWLLA
ncbi:UspA [Sesbania bispinosa]|nr:UspA [Sesbania bispinosa]